MGLIQRSSLWSSPKVKPAFGTVRINRSHPLAQGLNMLYLLNEPGGRPIDLTTGTDAVVDYTAVTHGPTERGLGRITDPATNVGIEPVSNYSHGGEFSIATIVAHAGTAGLTGFPTLVETNYITNFYLGGNGNNPPTKYTWIVNNTFLDSDDVDMTKMRVVVGTHGAGVSNLYVEGAAPKSMSATGPGAVTAPVKILAKVVANGPWKGRIAFVAGWRRVLSAAEVTWLTDEPYAMLEPVVKRRRDINMVAPAPTLHLVTSPLRW